MASDDRPGARGTTRAPAAPPVPATDAPAPPDPAAPAAAGLIGLASSGGEPPLRTVPSSLTVFLS